MIKLNEVFYEETALIKNPNSAKRKYNFINVLSILSYTIILFWIFIYLTSFAHVTVIFDIIVFLIPTSIFVLVGYLMGRFKNRFYQEYDYAFISGTVRVARVIKCVKRKFLLEFNCYDIEKIGEFGSDTYYAYEKIPDVKTQIFTPNDTPADGKDFYYMVVNINAEKNILVFECTKTFIINVLKFSKKTVLEKE